MNRLPVGSLLIAGLTLALVLTTCGSRRALAERDARVDSLRTETLAARADAMGWETRLMRATESLDARLQAADSTVGLLTAEKAALAREVETLGGRLSSMVDLYAGVVGSIETHDATVHGPERGSNEPRAEPDSVTAPIDDGLLSGRMVYVPPATLGLEYSVELALALGWVEAPDGRALVTARAADPRVQLRYGDVFWSPSPPVQYCGWGTRLAWGLGGAVAGGVVGFAGGVTLGGLP